MIYIIYAHCRSVLLVLVVLRATPQCSTIRHHHQSPKQERADISSLQNTRDTRTKTVVGSREESKSRGPGSELRLGGGWG